FALFQCVTIIPSYPDRHPRKHCIPYFLLPLPSEFVGNHEITSQPPLAEVEEVQVFNRSTWCFWCQLSCKTGVDCDAFAFLCSTGHSLLKQVLNTDSQLSLQWLDIVSQCPLLASLQAL
uniref:Uncharacterized protein n=1 Tax=Crocodylus porosus TaxID=8502 RepID=A0A7M4FMC8_CROPO